MIIQVTNGELLNNGFANGLINLYQKIFSEPPYNEFFTDEEVRILLTSYLEEGVLFLKYVEQEVVGFSAAVPFIKSLIFQATINDIDGKSTVFTIDFLEKKLGFASNNTWYLADLGVKQNYRSQGFGSELTSSLFQVLKTGTTTILRTSKFNNDRVQSFYLDKFEFQFLNISQDVEQLRKDGTVQSNKRVFMVKVI
jgi:ribosomal protein S18 acetylase RimI-like enzyme